MTVASQKRASAVASAGKHQSSFPQASLASASPPSPATSTDTDELSDAALRAPLRNGRATAPATKRPVERSTVAEPLASLPGPPSASYRRALATIAGFQRDVAAELARIAAANAPTPTEEGALVRRRASRGNPLETPRKKLLSAQVELARMDWMAEPHVAETLYAHAHLPVEEPQAKVAFESQQAWLEASHVLALYEGLRKQLAVKTRKRGMLFDILTLLVILVYTCVTIPFFVLTLCIARFNPLFVRYLGARNHFMPVDLIQKWYARGFLCLCGIKVQWKGIDEHVNYDESTLGMFSHASNLDPVIVASGPLAFKWIGKKSLFRVPVIGPLLSGLGHIPIERENREKAIASLKKAAEQIHLHKRCVAISPEGTRSRSGRIGDFKKGAFHTAMEVGAPITPLLIEGAFDLWPSGSIFAQPGVVSVTFLEPIRIRAGEDDYNTLAAKVRRAFFVELLESAKRQCQEEEEEQAQRGGESRKAR